MNAGNGFLATSLYQQKGGITPKGEMTPLLTKCAINKHVYIWLWTNYTYVREIRCEVTLTFPLFFLIGRLD